jgi:MFS family permease
VSPGRSRLAFLFRALGHRNYRLFFAGQAVSMIGTWMQSVAQAWLAYRLTGSAAMLGLVGFAGQIPTFLLSAAGGVVADRYDKRRVMQITQAASMTLAFAFAALTLAERIEIGGILAFATALGLVNAFDIPARQAFVVEMVGREDLLNAIALNSSVFHGARVIGPAIAGVLVARVGEGWCFFINGSSYLAVLVALAAMRMPARAPAAERPSPFASLIAGLRFVGSNRPVRALLLLVGVVSLTGMPYAVLMPVFADRILGTDARGHGILMGCAGTGAFVGALALASRSGVRGLGRWVASAAAGFGVALVAFSASRDFLLSAVLLVPVGFAMMIGMAASNTLLQAMVPDDLRGRVMAAYAMVFMGMAPLGSLAAGYAADRFGAPAAVTAGGVLCLAGAAVFNARVRPLSAEARRMIVAAETAAGEPPAGATGGAPSAAVPAERRSDD